MTAALNPRPLVYPQCSECGSAYVLRRAMLFSLTADTIPSDRLLEDWVWQRDCKHRKADPVMVDKRPKRKAKP